MAQVTKLIDDINGNDADMTLSFGLDGIEYAIDLDDQNYEQYRKTLEFLAAHGRVVTRDPVKVKRASTVQRATQTTGKTTEMREWLRSQGHDVKDRGRVPQHLVDLWGTRPRGVVLGEDDMREVVASLKDDKAAETPQEAPKGEDTTDEVSAEDKAAEAAVVARVRTTPKGSTRARTTKGVKKDAGKQVEIPAIREVLSLSGGDE